MVQPKVSIVVPVYNAEKYLERCINSITNQTLREIEIIFIDDSSTDSSLEICKEAAKRDERIKVIHKENEGAGLARNAGLKIATGKYIGFVDSDDFIENEMYKTLYEKAEKYNSDLIISGFVFYNGIMFGNEGTAISRTYFDKDTQFDTVESLKKLKMGIIGAAPGDPVDSRYGTSIWKNLFKNDIIRENNLTFLSEREILSEDSLFILDYISCINRATGIPEAFYNYCRNEDSVSKSFEKDRLEQSEKYVNEVVKRFEINITPQEYQVYLDRFWLSICRGISSQEVIYAVNNNLKYSELKKRLKVICTHELTAKALKSYPIGTLPLKRRVFAVAMKFKLYFLLKMLVELRNR